MVKKTNIPQSRIDENFKKEMRRIAKVRLSKGLAKVSMSDLSIREMTRLLTKTDGFQVSLKELETKPKSEDLR